MNINYCFHGSAYYCSDCGCFFDNETHQVLDIPYTDLYADFALKVMQDRQKGFADCHLKQRAKPRQRCKNSLTAREVKNIIYRGRGISCYQIDRYNFKIGKSEPAWICRHGTSEFVGNDLSQLVARIKDYIDWEISGSPEMDIPF